MLRYDEPVSSFDFSFKLASLRYNKGEGAAAPNYPAATGWYRRAADAGVVEAAFNLFSCYAIGRGRTWQIMPATSSSKLETLVS
jgi:hypothetical protein